MQNTENVENPSKKNPWLWVILTIPTLIVIAGFCTVLITFLGENKQSTSNVKSLSASASFVNSIQHAQNFNYRAEFQIDNSVMEVVIYADNQIGPENLNLDLVLPSNKATAVQVRLFNSGNNIFKGNLPANFEYAKWHIAIYPDSETPAWRIESEMMFPQDVVSIKG